MDRIIIALIATVFVIVKGCLSLLVKGGLAYIITIFIGWLLSPFLQIHIVSSFIIVFVTIMMANRKFNKYLKQKYK